MPPSPDFRSAGKQREGVLEFEGPLGSFVAEDSHADESAGPAAEGAEQHQR